MERGQYTFFASFRRAAAHIKKKADRCDFYDAISDYALYGIDYDPSKYPSSVAAALELVKPNLDSSRRKAESGKRGGSKKQPGSKPEANGKQPGSEKEKEIEKEKEKEVEIENECYYPPIPPSSKAPSPLTTPTGAVIADFLNRINPSASKSCLDMLKAYAEELGPDVCMRAFDIALDSKKATWPYIQAILQDKCKKGVRCLADWDALDDNRRKTTAPQVQTDGRRKTFSEILDEMEEKRHDGA